MADFDDSLVSSNNTTYLIKCNTFFFKAVITIDHCDCFKCISNICMCVLKYGQDLCCYLCQVAVNNSTHFFPSVMMLFYIEELEIQIIMSLFKSICTNIDQCACV